MRDVIAHYESKLGPPVPLAGIIEPKISRGISLWEPENAPFVELSGRKVLRVPKSKYLAAIQYRKCCYLFSLIVETLR